MKKKKKKKNTPARFLRTWFIRLVLLGSLAGITVLAFYLGYLSRQIDTRFAGRRWAIPSTVYSDTTLLYPGQALNRPLFYEKLERIGYRRVSHAPRQAGEMRISGSAVDLYLREFSVSSYRQAPGPVKIAFDKNHISAITRQDARSPLGLLELEPEPLMHYFGPDREQRQLVSITHLPQWLIHAVLAAEDHRFYGHYGVEPLAILRALVTNLRKGGIRQGGSTITQQLAKNYFLSPERTLRRKLKELLITGILEYKYDKNDILEIYLNEIYFGQKGSVAIHGIGAAARFYFDKPPSELSAGQAAALAGLIKAPNYYSPYKDALRCVQRRNEVLTAMGRHGWLSDGELKQAVAQPLKPAGYKGYRRRAPYFMDYLGNQLSDLYSRDVLFSQGLAIFTTIDTQVQIAAEKALKHGLERLESAVPHLRRKDPAQKLQGAVIVMQPKTGYILALVGGRDYGVSQFNRATQARRQPGSAFKPFVFLTALDSHTPRSLLSNAPQTYLVNGRPWQPKNYNENAPHRVTLREALAYSHNIAAINLALDVGLEKVAETALAFRFDVPEPPYPSLALGALPVSPLALARAYCVFPADGMLPYPLSIKAVVDSTGEVVENRHASIEKLICPEKAYMISNLLSTVAAYGTARSLGKLGIDYPVAAKTGTTNDSRDAWFIGYTPSLLALVWVGFDNGDSIEATGARAALPIWAELMNSLPQHASGEDFNIPPGIVSATVCTETGELANDGCCPSVAQDIFLDANLPDSPCSRHRCPSKLQRLWEGMKNIVR